MEERMTRALQSHNDTKQRMDLVVITEIDPTTQRSLLQEVIQIVRLAQEHHHV